LKANLLFSDGAVGVLIIPESMKDRFKRPLMKVIDVATGFEQGAEIKMEDGRFLVGDNVKSVMPELVTRKVLKPLLKKNDLMISDINEWSIHQGGKPILEIFKDEDILGLDDSQLSRSKELFEEYGNFSSPSCLFVLDSFFKEDSAGKNSNTHGAVVSFGAGYYLASLIYNWD
jgi:predicted naringenin-chalcone synthase